MTQLLVLGLLKKEPLSGYDIQVMLQTSDAQSWGGVLVGSIYHALRKLEKGGYIEVLAIEQTGHRQKAVYSITAAGEKHFNELLLSALKSNSVSYPTLLYSGLNFMDSLGKEQVISALQCQRDTLKGEKERLERGRIEKKQYMGGELLPLSEMVFEHMLTTIQQQIHFIEQVMQWIQS